MAAAIEFADVSKRYLLGVHHGSQGSLRETLAASANRIARRRPRDRPTEIWSLKDVSFEIAEGDTLGIIGRNGAGKSTLLKVLTRITEPTRGVSRTRGRVGALLEVGTGFHPELTGRENIYLNGAILGMGRRVVDRRFEEIVEFADVARFLDTPIKRYSSGMYLRLAFAVAAHLDADILAVDEVLAVGDAEFQRKCLAKMGSLHEGGRTVVFVSHNLDAINALCPVTMWLDEGRIEAHGPTREIVNRYLASGTSLSGTRTFDPPPGKSAAILQTRLLDAAGNAAVAFSRDDPVTVEIRFAVYAPTPDLDLTVFIHNVRGIRVLEEAWSERVPDALRGTPGEFVVRVVIPPVLAVDEYVAGFWMGSRYEEMFYEDDVLRFRLDGRDHGRPNRVIDLGLDWSLQPVGEQAPAPS